MQAIYNLLYEPGIPLKVMGILLGVWLIASHAIALTKPDLVKPWLKGFPRNEKIGTVLVIIAFAWTFVVWSCMDLGEFFKIEKPVQMILVAGCVGVIVYVKEFLAVRSLGFLMILAAAPILDSAFLKEPQTRLLIVALAYVIALKGMFWVGMPYLMRDQINWVLAKDKRYQIGALAGAVYGLVVLACALAWW
ncbi:MAG: hypothetical protein NWR21_02060 [Verrucomicrobiales bacterium]|jgi:hypothetical protein|nr:hypothetical protein [Verrucomicrobiales bacterium]MDP4792860.1 hypothetical protein [Verrucomicrobiales bacterium]MDP4849642.1 hypothetical protein [Verrucomicrobiales bacterium]MDP4938075.1 hypothetical protein [Verrucomicrobiales bacterium]MDP5006605.1 hypothetical protein [Verrucomicrobiales bacterium]